MASDNLSPAHKFEAVVSAARAAARLSSACILLAHVLALSAAHADDLLVTYDQSQLLRLSQPAAEIIIGNPSIADIAIQGGSLLVVTGKSFGVTNLIALDQDGNVIEERRIMVRRDEAKIVNVYKGPKRETYNCADACNPTITVGDSGQFFEETAKQSERKAKLSAGHGGSGGGEQ